MHVVPSGTDPLTPYTGVFANPKAMKILRGTPLNERRLKIVKAMLNEIKLATSGPKIPRYDLSWFDRKSTIHASLSATYLPLEEPIEIVTDLFEKIVMRPWKFTENEGFLLTCLCKVLEYNGVARNDIMAIDALRESLGRVVLLDHFHGAVWANQLLERLESGAWGRQGLDLLLFCKPKSNRPLNRVS